MYKGYLTFEDGRIFIENYELNGIIKDLNITGKIRFDSAQTDSLSGTKKTPMGWEDATISIQLELTTDEDSSCYEKLNNINNIFMGQDDDGNPKVLKIYNKHTQARNVDDVIFSSLESQESDIDDIILVKLNFIEFLPVIVETEKKEILSNTENEEEIQEPELDSKISIDLETEKWRS